MTEIDRLYSELYSEYPDEFQSILRLNRSRILWQVGIVSRHVAEGGKLIDIGAGIVPFMLICQKLGYNATVVDDLADDTYQSKASMEVLELFDKSGVRFIKADAFTDDLASVTNLDMVTSHDSMEHWHNSPKRMFHNFWSKMNSGALFFLGVPNCVNLRKRITVPFGHGKWSQMKDWYEPEIFRGHVREPDVDDLRYIANDLKASRHEIHGRNWIGYRHPSGFVRSLTPVIDR